MQQSYVVPTGRFRAELEIKKSRFICTLDPIADEEQGKAIRLQLQKEFPAANHHCWAQQLGSAGAIQQACSDDGEPHGTAGKPILNQLHHAGILQIQAVVTRIFGGVKLGTGGLVRAYSDAVANALESVPTEPLIQWQQVSLEFGYDFEPLIRQYLQNNNVRDEHWQYTDRVSLQCAVPVADGQEINSTLTNLCSGRLVFKFVE